MARKPVVEVQCDRCPRTEYREDDKDVGDAFWGAMAGSAPVTFKDLCAPCEEAVRQHWEAISRKLNTMSPDRKKDVAKKEEVEPKPPPSQIKR